MLYCIDMTVHGGHGLGKQELTPSTVIDRPHCLGRLDPRRVSFWRRWLAWRRGHVQRGRDRCGVANTSSLLPGQPPPAEHALEAVTERRVSRGRATIWTEATPPHPQVQKK